MCAISDSPVTVTLFLWVKLTSYNEYLSAFLLDLIISNSVYVSEKTDQGTIFVASVLPKLSSMDFAVSMPRRILAIGFLQV